MQTRLEMQSRGTAFPGGWRMPLSGKQRAAVDWALVDDHQAVLDLSCADGYLLRYYAQRYQLRACGVCYDASQAQKTRESLPSAEIMYSPSADIPWQEDSFDRVLLTEAPPSFGHPFDLLRETIRVLKPGGMLIAIIPCLPFQNTLSMPFSGAGRDIALSRRQMLETMETYGFEDVSLRQTRMVYAAMIAHKGR